MWVISNPHPSDWVTVTFPFQSFWQWMSSLKLFRLEVTPAYIHRDNPHHQQLLLWLMPPFCTGILNWTKSELKASRVQFDIFFGQVPGFKNKFRAVNIKAQIVWGDLWHWDLIWKQIIHQGSGTCYGNTNVLCSNYGQIPIARWCFSKGGISYNKSTSSSAYQVYHSSSWHEFHRSRDCYSTSSSQTFNHSWKKPVGSRIEKELLQQLPR